MVLNASASSWTPTFGAPPAPPPPPVASPVTANAAPFVPAAAATVFVPTAAAAAFVPADEPAEEEWEAHEVKTPTPEPAAAAAEATAPEAEAEAEPEAKKDAPAAAAPSVFTAKEDAWGDEDDGPAAPRRRYDAAALAALRESSGELGENARRKLGVFAGATYAKPVTPAAQPIAPGRDFGPRGGDRGGRGGRGARRGDREEEKWVPVTKLGRLVQTGAIKKLEQVFLFSMPIKEYQIVDFFLGTALTDEVMKIMNVQKQTSAGARMRFKAFVVVGDSDGHLGLGVKCAKEVATAIRGAIISAKMALIPVRRGYWGNKIGKPHTIPTKLTGKCGSVTVRLIPAPKGAGIVAARTPKKLLQLAGIKDVYTASRGHTRTLGNFVKATFFAIRNSYSFLTPELWRETKFIKTPFQEFTDVLAKPVKATNYVSEDKPPMY